ncbi:MAG: GNAT family N-acetyltransferase [Actinomycetota bacterium]|nr:GNAT family N-acetyltransferase [Actinomycetota bacterium]
MDVSWRLAQPDDISRLVQLYGPALREQSDLREAWTVAEGLPEPIPEAFASIIGDVTSFVAVGLIDGNVFGFIWARIEPLLPQADGEQMGVIRLVYVAEAARTVGVGEVMLEAALASMRGRGVRRFDAVVSPGHRLAKNFFESAGFSARRITMYHRDSNDE